MAKLKQNKILLLTVLLSVLAVFAGSLTAPIEMNFVNSVLQDDSLASLVFTVGTIASLIGVLLINKIVVTKSGNKKALSVLFLFLVFLPILYANSFNMLTIYGVKFAWALAAAGVGPIVNSILQTELNRNKNTKVGLAYGWIYAVESGTGMAAALLGGVLADLLGFGVVFFLVSLVFLAQFVVVQLILREDQKIDISRKKTEQKGGLREGIKYVFSNRELLLRIMLDTAFKIAWNTKVILYPLIILSVVDLNTVVGAVMAMQGLAAMLVLPLVGKLVDSKGYRNVLLVGYMILAVGLLIFGLSGSIAILFVAAVLVAIGEACNGPAMATLEVRAIPDRLRNSVNSFHQVYGTLLSIAATAAIALLLVHFDAQAIIIGMSGVVVLILFVGFAFVDRKKLA